MFTKILISILALSLIANGIQFYLRPKAPVLPAPMVQLQKAIVQDTQAVQTAKTQATAAQQRVDALKPLSWVVSAVSLSPAVLEQLQAREVVYIQDLEAKDVVIQAQDKTIADKTLLIKDYQITIEKVRHTIRIWKVVSGVLVLVIVILIV